MPHAPLRITVVGLRHGKTHVLEAIQHRPDLALVGVCDRDPDTFQSIAAVVDESRRYLDYEQMLEQTKPDAVVIATPVRTHLALAKIALQRNIHTLLEKPMTDTLAEAYELAEVADKTDAVLQIAYEFRSSPLIRKAKEIIDSVELGQIVVVWTTMFRGPAPAGPGTWRDETGLFFDCMIHEIDGMMDFADADFERVFAFGAPQGVKGLKPADQPPHTVTAAIEFENAVRGSIAFSELSQTYDNTHFGIVGDKGRIEGGIWEPEGAGSLKLYTHGGLFRTKIDVAGDKTSRGHLGFAEQYNFFLDTIHNDAPNVSDTHNGLRTQRLMAAIEQSMVQGQIIERAAMQAPGR